MFLKLKLYEGFGGIVEGFRNIDLTYDMIGN